MRPLSVPKFIEQAKSLNNDELTAAIKANYKRLLKGAPEVSIVIPAYNEEANILTTLLTITNNITSYSVEVIVVNNNSKDRTEELVLASGIKCIRETIPGPGPARTAGLHAARGTYIMNADADTIYPPHWIEKMITPIKNDNKIALTYGRFAFLPGEDNSRFAFFLYENFADVLRWVKRNFKEEAVNVYGCNSAFRRDHCLAVNGYEHPAGTNEDGWLAIKLRTKGYGKLHYVPTVKAMAWTVDRHLQHDGGLRKAFFMRIKQALFSK